MSTVLKIHPLTLKTLQTNLLDSKKNNSDVRKRSYEKLRSRCKERSTRRDKSFWLGRVNCVRSRPACRESRVRLMTSTGTRIEFEESPSSFVFVVMVALL